MKKVKESLMEPKVRLNGDSNESPKVRPGGQRRGEIATSGESAVWGRLEAMGPSRALLIVWPAEKGPLASIDLGDVLNPPRFDSTKLAES